MEWSGPIALYVIDICNYIKISFRRGTSNSHFWLMLIQCVYRHSTGQGGRIRIEPCTCWVIDRGSDRYGASEA